MLPLGLLTGELAVVASGVAAETVREAGRFGLVFDVVMGCTRVNADISQQKSEKKDQVSMKKKKNKHDCFQTKKI